MSKIEEIRKLWEEYKHFLQMKYPADEGSAWQFTCPYHKKINDILENDDE